MGGPPQEDRATLPPSLRKLSDLTYKGGVPFPPPDLKLQDSLRI